MVETALRALFFSAARQLAPIWESHQTSINQKHPPEYIHGLHTTWQNIITRLCNGCLKEDSQEIFYKWLSNYKDHLIEAQEKESIYIKGQIDAFNEFLIESEKLINKENVLYKKKLDEIIKKQEELQVLHNELENIIWSHE